MNCTRRRRNRRLRRLVGRSRHSGIVGTEGSQAQEHRGGRIAPTFALVGSEAGIIIRIEPADPFDRPLCRVSSSRPGSPALPAALPETPRRASSMPIQKRYSRIASPPWQSRCRQLAGHSHCLGRIAARRRRPLLLHPEGIEYFERHVRPVFAQNCLKCHGEKQQGGLRLNWHATAIVGGDSGPAIAAGNPQASLLVQALHYKDEISRL